MSELSWSHYLELIKIDEESKRSFYLNEPVYSEPSRNSVLLVLDNNISIRVNRNQETLKNNIKYIWDELSYPEKTVLQVISDKGEISADEVEKIINRKRTTSLKVLNNLIEKKLIVWTGTSKNDAYGKYIMK